MAVFPVERASWSAERLVGEVGGAFGDSVTVLPVVVAVGTLTELSLATALLGFAAFQVVWGLHYGAPVSVEPMKALAALVIAGGLSTGGYVLAGLLAGGVLLVAGTTGVLGRVQRHVGRPVVRGVQLAVALLLVKTGLELGAAAPALAVLAAVPALLAAAAGYRRVVPLLVLVVGGVVAVQAAGAPSFAMPALAAPPVSLADPLGVAGATLGQLAMTVGNAAVATSLLLSDYYDVDVSPDALASSMGAMNLVAVPLGALPMCHGSGGVAGKYAFGARSSAANVVLGAGYAAVALFAADLARAFPMSVLGVVLVAVAIELGRTALDSEDLVLTALVGVVGLLANVGVAFLLGLAVHAARRRRDPGN